MQRIAHAAFPDLVTSPVARSVGTPLTVAGAATDRRKPTVFPFHPRSNRGTVLWSCPASGRVVKWSATRLRHAAELKPRRPRPGARVGQAQTPKKIGPDFGGQICERFRGRASRPEQRSSSHNAVILVSAMTGRQVTMEFSASAERVSAPNSVSANRRSISCCNRASASAAVHGGAQGKNRKIWR